MDTMFFRCFTHYTFVSDRDERATQFAIELVVISLLVGLVTGFGGMFIPMNVLVIALIVGTAGLVVVAFRLFTHVDSLIDDRLATHDSTPQDFVRGSDTATDADADDEEEAEADELEAGFEWGGG